MKWIGQHIWDFISRFRSDVYLEGTESGTIASGGNLGLDSNNKIVKANTGDALSFSGSTSNGVLTYKDADEISVESTMTYTSDMLSLGSSESGKPVVTLSNTNTDAVAPVLNFWKDVVGANDDKLGTIRFIGEDDGTGGFAYQSFAEIVGSIKNAVAGSEAGRLEFNIAEYDGTVTTGLKLEGQPDDGEIDVTIGAGAASTTTIAGDLHVGGETITSDGYSGQSTSAGTLSWNGATCKIFPNEFMVDDGGGTWRVFESAGAVYSGRCSDTSTEAICWFRIPDGKKVTSVKFNTTTTATNICSVRPYNYVTGAAGTEQDFNSNSLVTVNSGTLTAITGALTTDLLLTFKPASSTTGLFGVLVAIADV